MMTSSMMTSPHGNRVVQRENQRHESCMKH